MTDVFISDSSKDRDRTRGLATALADLGMSVWWDREILTGQVFDHAIEQELESAKSIVVLWSQDSADSEWVKNEASAAAERGVLLPASIDGTRLPLEFRRKQTADLSGWSGDPAHAGFQALVRAINSVVGGIAMPSRASTAATANRPDRRVIVGVITVAVAIVLAGASVSWRGDADKPVPIATASQTPGAVTSGPRRPVKPSPGLADAVAGTYVGNVIADSKGSSRSNVVVTVDQLGRDAVRVSSPSSRVGTIDVELTQHDKTILNAAGDTPFIVDLAATPPTLSLNPRNELAFHGTLRQ